MGAGVNIRNGGKEMRTVWLKNGTEEVKMMIVFTMDLLRSLLHDNPIAMYELVMVCRDSKHIPFGNTSEELQKLLLLQPDGRPHNSIRNIVLSAVMGDGLDMCLVNPIDKEVS